MKPLPALANQINGNAIYNLSHPLFNRIVEALESEADTAGNSVAYDFRLSQIIDEAKGGAQALSLPTANYSAVFADFENIDDAIRETTLIGNYAGMNMLKSLLNPKEAIIHGAKIHLPWSRDLLGVRLFGVILVSIQN